MPRNKSRGKIGRAEKEVVRPLEAPLGITTAAEKVGSSGASFDRQGIPAKLALIGDRIDRFWCCKGGHQINFVAQDQVLRDLGGRFGLTRPSRNTISSRYVVPPMMICRRSPSEHPFDRPRNSAPKRFARGPVCGATNPIFTVFVAAVANLPKPTTNGRPLRCAASGVW